MIEIKYLEEFLEYKRTVENYSELTIMEYKYNITNFFNYLKEVSIHDLSKLELQDFHKYICYLKNEKGNSDTTRARKMSSIKVFFKYLSVKGYIHNNPTYYLETPKKPKKIVKYMTLSDSERLLTNIKYDDNVRYKERNIAIITFFLNCGIRLSELININIDDVNLSEMTILIKRKRQ